MQASGLQSHTFLSPCSETTVLNTADAMNTAPKQKERAYTKFNLKMPKKVCVSQVLKLDYRASGSQTCFLENPLY